MPEPHAHKGMIMIINSLVLPTDDIKSNFILLGEEKIPLSLLNDLVGKWAAPLLHLGCPSPTYPSGVRSFCKDAEQLPGMSCYNIIPTRRLYKSGKCLLKLRLPNGH